MQGRSRSCPSSIEERFDELIVAGGDERLTLDSDGLNKYHLDPRSSTGTLHRGSCTCSPINHDARRAALESFDRIRSGATTVSEVFDQQRNRLLDIFVPGPHDGADVVFAPSGSDLCFLPLLFSLLLHPGRRIVNVVATSEELGSGSLLAHDGRYFAAKSQVEQSLPVGDELTGRLDVESIALPARDERGGIVDQAAAIERIVLDHDPGDVLIVNLVIGSKSGIENGVRIIERFIDRDIVWTVDLCQMRARPALFEHLLGLGCLLLCTGSKFYEAPPFCGAMLVPGVWTERLASVDTASPEGFDRIFSRSDFPPALDTIGSSFPVVDNVGLCLRWEAALHEMEAFDAVPAQDSAAAIAEWNACVVERIGRSATLELLRDQDRTNDSIVSFRVVDGSGSHLDRHGLAEIHRRLAVEGAPQIQPFARATIGQPVSYTSGSFLRLALGSSDARDAAIEGFDPWSDLALVDAIETIAEELR